MAGGTCATPEMVTICIKGSPRKASSKKPRDEDEKEVTSSTLAVDEGIFDIDSARLLPFEFFEAQLKRWQRGSGHHRITVTIAATDVAKGTELLRKRLLGQRFEEPRDDDDDDDDDNDDDEEEDVEEDEDRGDRWKRDWEDRKDNPEKAAEGEGRWKVAEKDKQHEKDKWTAVDWWRACDGDYDSLSAALHIFDVTLLRAFSKEVALTLRLYRFPCSKAVASMAARAGVHDVTVEVANPISQSVSDNYIVGPLLLDMVFSPLSSSWTPKGSKGLFALASRAIAGSEADDLLADALYTALSEASGTRFRPVEGVALEHMCSVIPWLLRQCGEAVRRNPKVAVHFAKACTAKFEELQSEPLDAADWYERQDALRQDSNQLLFVCLCTLLVQSARQSDARIVESEINELLLEGAGWTADFEFHDDFPPSFAVATPLAQMTCVRGLPMEVCPLLLRNHIHLVHERVRHMFLTRTEMLSPDDVMFLSKADFPGFGSEEVLPVPKSFLAEPAIRGLDHPMSRANSSDYDHDRFG